MNTRTLLVLLGACLIAELAGGTEARASDRFRVRAVAFEGNVTYASDRLQQLMLTVPSGFLHRSEFYPEVFAADLANIIAFYNDNGFLQAAISDTVATLDSLARSADIAITIAEGPRTRLDTLIITGNTLLATDSIRSLIGLNRDDPYRRTVLQRGMVAIVSQYGARGYIDASVKPDLRMDSAAARVAVTLRISEGHPITVRSVVLQGLEHTRDAVVLRELFFAAGDTIRPALLLASQRRLYRTHLFKSVYVHVTPPPDSAATARDVLIEIVEAHTGAFSAAIGYGSVERVRGRLEVATRNLMGTARQIALRLAASSINRSIEASLTEPRTLGTRWQTDLSTLFGVLDEPAFYAERWELRGVVGRALTDNINIAFSVRTENATLQDVLVDDLPEDFGSNTRSLSASLRYDSRDNLFAPSRGIYGEWSNELAGAILGGTNEFARTVLRLRGFTQLTSSTVIGSSLECGAIAFLGQTDSVPLNERFYAGGPTSVRGFDYQMIGPRSESGDPLGGRYKLVWNLLEVRQVVYKMFGAVAFCDLGGVWSAADAIRLDDLRTAAGVGLRAGTPIGIVRIDFGINLDPRGDEPPNRLHLSAGHAF